MRTAPETTLEMACSRREFGRLVARLARKAESFSQIDNDHWRLRFPEGMVMISFHALPARRSGALTLPRARVCLDMRALPTEARRAFLSLFRHAFFRGGG